LLTAAQVVVLEFKQKTSPSAADCDQAAAYGRDLREYHAASHALPIVSGVVLTRQTQPLTEKFENVETAQSVAVLAPMQIADFLAQLPELPESEATIDPQAWVQADYAPLPTVMQAARQIFQRQPLPSIKRAQSAGIPDLLAYLEQLAHRAQQQQERHLVIITGVPGAGKTLVGLQFVYQQPQSPDSSPPAVFLTGNGPLLQVLQYALKSKVFVQAVRNFYLQYEARRQKAPPEHMIVFDEAQRAWDRDRMAEKYGITSAAGGAILRIAERIPDWSIVVSLIGEGQEIHVGEEEGLEQWNDGLQQAQSTWQVHCAPEQADIFTAIAPESLHCDQLLNLTTSLRSHLAKDVQTWVAHVLLGNIAAAAALMPVIQQAGFNAYMTRRVETAKQYCRDRYQHQPSKRYGFVASSRARNLPQYGIANDFKSTQRLRVGPWYIDPPDSPLSCCQFEGTVTEFGCQGLELDMPVIGWGTDLLWDGQQWLCKTRQRNVKDPLRLRLNSYRVLLTRGRDGFIIFVPPEAKLDDTFTVLSQAGLLQLD
jgi:hypothetical protein